MGISSSFVNGTNEEEENSYDWLDTNQSKLQIKQQSSNQKYNKKSSSLGYKPMILDRMPDADTYGFRGLDGLVRASDFNSYETYHEGFTDTEYMKRTMPKQRAMLAAQLGVDPSEITDRHVWANAKKIQLESLARATGSPDWKAGPIDLDPKNQPNLDDPDNPLGIQVNGRIDWLNKNINDKSPRNVYGRHLGSVEGIAPQQIDEVTQAKLALADLEKNGYASDDFEMDPLNTAKRALVDIAAFTPEVAAVAVDAGTWIADTIARRDPSKRASASDFIEGLKEKTKKAIGYDGRSYQIALQKFQNKAYKIFQDDKLSNEEKAIKAGELLYDNANLSPDLLADSLVFISQMKKNLLDSPRVLGMTLGRGSKKAELASKIDSIAKGEKISKPELSLSNKIDNMVDNRFQRKNLLGDIQRGVAKDLLKGGGIPKTLVDTPEAIKEWEKNNPDGEATLSDRVRLTFGKYIENKLDQIVDTATMGLSPVGKSAYKVLGKAIRKLPPTSTGSRTTKGLVADLFNATIKPIIGLGAKGAASIGTESVTEGMQEIIGLVNTRYGTSLYEDKEFLGLLDEDVKAKVIKAAAAGALGSIGQAPIGIATSGLSRDRNTINDNDVMSQAELLSENISTMPKSETDAIFESLTGVDNNNEETGKPNFMKDYFNMTDMNKKEKSLQQVFDSINSNKHLKKKLKTQKGKNGISFYDVIKKELMNVKQANIEIAKSKDKAMINNDEEFNDKNQDTNQKTNQKKNKKNKNRKQKEQFNKEEIDAELESKMENESNKELDETIAENEDLLNDLKNTEPHEDATREELDEAIKKVEATIADLKDARNDTGKYGHDISLGAGVIQDNLSDGVKVKLDTELRNQFGSVKTKKRTVDKNKTISKEAQNQVSDENIVNFIFGKAHSKMKELFNGLAGNSKTKRTIIDKLTKPSGLKKTLNHFVKKATKSISTEHINSKLSKTIFTDLNEDGTVNINSSQNKGTATRLAAVTIDNIVGGMRATIDLANKKYEQMESPYAIRDEITREIGKQFYKSQGLVLQGSDKAVNKQYMLVGEAGLELVENMGLIESSREGTSLSKPLVDEFNDSEYVTSRYTEGDIDEAGIPVKDIVRLKDAKLSKYTMKGNELSSSLESQLADSLKPLLAVMNISNFEVPSMESTTEYKKDTSTSKQFDDIVAGVQHGRLTMKPEYFDQLNNIREEVEKYKGGIAEAIEKDRYIGMFFGVNSIDGTNEGVSSILNKQRRNGQEIGIISNAEAMLNALDDIDPDNMYYSYLSAVQKRLHVNQNVFNFQADNIVARHIMSNGTHEINVRNEDGTFTDEYKFAVEYVADELGIDPNAIISGKLPEEIAHIADGIHSSVDMKTLFNTVGSESVLFDGKSPIAQYELIKSIAELRDGDKTVKLSNPISGDANFSGTMNTFTNIFGLTDPKAANELMSKIGWFSKDTDTTNMTVGDAYELIVTALKKQGIENKELQTTLDFMTNVFGDKADKKFRNFAKYPLMTFIYGQQSESLQRGLGTEMFFMLAEGKENKIKNADNILNKAIDDAIKDKKRAKELKEDGTKISIKESNLISKELGKNIGESMSLALESISPDYQIYKKINNKIYEQLANVRMNEDAKNYDKILLRDPFIVTLDALQKEGDETIPDLDIKPEDINFTGFPIEKLKGVVLGTTGKVGNKKNIPGEMFMPESNQAKVMPQHAVDTAILLISFMKTAKSLGMDLNKDYDGSMLIHDAVYSDPVFVAEYTKHYNETIPQVAKHYDFINEMKLELERAQTHVSNMYGQKVDENGLKAGEDTLLYNNIKDVLDSIEDGSIVSERDPVSNEERLKRKNEFLDNNKVAGFGTFKKHLDDNTELGELELKPIKEVEEEVEEEPTTEATSKTETKTKTKTKNKPTKKKNKKLVSFKVSANRMIKTLNDETKSIDEKMDAIRDIVVKSGASIHTDAIVVALQNIEYFLGSKDVVPITKGDEFLYNEKNGITTTTKSTSNVPVKNMEDFIKFLNHEIEHAQTYNYIKSEQAQNSKEYKFISSFLDSARMTNLLMKTDSDLLRDRMAYVRSKDTVQEQVAEFVAIMRAEPKVRRELQNALGSHSTIIWSRLYKFIRTLSEFIYDYSDDTVTSIMIANAVDNLAAQADLYENMEPTDDTNLGAGFKHENESLDSMLKYKPYKGAKNLQYGPVGSILADVNKILSGALYYVGGSFDSIFVKSGFASKVDSSLNRKSKLYRDSKKMAQNLYADGSLLGRLSGYLQLEKGIDYKEISKMRTAISQAQQIKHRIDSEIIAKAKKGLNNAKLTDDEMNVLGTIMGANISSISSLPDHTGRTTLDNILESKDPVKELDRIIKDTEDLLNKDAINLAKSFSKFDTEYVLDEALANIGSKTIVSMIGEENIPFVYELSTLYSLKKGDNLDVLGKVKEKAPSAYTELMSVASAASYAAQQADLDINDQPLSRVTNRTGMKNVYKKSYDFKVVTEREAKYDFKKEDGWITVREADYKKGIMGIVARENEGFGIQTGIISSVSLNNDALYLSGSKKGSNPIYRSMNNAIPIGKNKKPESRIILTKKELAKLEVETNPFDSLYRGLAHNQEVFETKKLYKDIIERQIVDLKDPKNIKKLDNLLNREIKEGEKIPLFLSISKDQYDGLPDSIKNKYVKPPRVTNIFQLNKRISLVHKNYVDELSGYERHALTSKNNPKLYKAEKLWRSLIVMFKAHVVMGNPAKIANDSMSNLSILLAFDVPLNNIKNYGQESIKLNSDMTKLRNNLIDLKLEFMSEIDSNRKKSISKQIENLQKKIKNHPFAPALNNGFIQSIGTDMMTKESDSISGLKVDLDNLFDKALDYKSFRKSLKWFMKFGYSAEDIIRFVNDQAEKLGTDKNVQIRKTIDKLESIKDDKDMKSYLHQIIATPGASEIIRHGGNATLYIDTMSRWILYKHLKDSGMSEEKAVETTLSAFVDYRTNLPAELDQLSALGIWMFPQFSLKIQRLIWTLLTERPGSSAAGIGFSAVSDTYPMSIFASNLLQKDFSHIDGLNANMVAPAEFWSL